MVKALQGLVLAGVRLIINFNYTQDFLHVITNLGDSRIKIVRIIDRSHLGSWNLHQLLFPPQDTVHIIHIHGFINPLGTDEPGPVLDHKSYDEATFGTGHYKRLLNRIFQDFTVITAGLSWGDVPLRSAAAEVQFEYPIVSRTHYAILHHQEPVKDLWKERGLISSYSVRPLYYSVQASDSHEESGSILKAVTKRNDFRRYDGSLMEREMVKLANRLDGWGDYEAGPQSDWMSENFSTVKSALEHEWDNVTPKLWLALARIERHFRHYIWFSVAQENKAQTRAAIWEKIANLWSHLPVTERRKIWNPDKFASIKPFQNSNGWLDYTSRGVFEFAIGTYEVQYESKGIPASLAFQAWTENLELILASAHESFYGQRIAIAQEVWLESAYRSEASLQTLRKFAARCAWESIESKIALDQAQTKFNEIRERILAKQGATGETSTNIDITPRNWNNAIRQELLDLSDDAKAIARMAGCFRREVGAVVLGSFVAPLQVAERNLIAIYKRCVENSGRSRELLMIWWIYFGLLAVLCEQRRGKICSGEEGLQWLKQLCDQPKPLDENAREAITSNSIPHWGKYHSGAATLARKVAELI
jgi:hypothetical protein